MSIHPEMKALVKSLFVAVADREELTEEQRQVLAAMEDFEPAATFQAIDTSNKSYLTPRDLCEFMKANNSHKVTEDDFFLLIKYFDSTEQGVLNLNDYIQILLPCSNDYLRSMAAKRKLPRSCPAMSREVENQL